MNGRLSRNLGALFSAFMILSSYCMCIANAVHHLSRSWTVETVPPAGLENVLYCSIWLTESQKHQSFPVVTYKKMLTSCAAIRANCGYSLLTLADFLSHTFPTFPPETTPPGKWVKSCLYPVLLLPFLSFGTLKLLRASSIGPCTQ